MKREEAAEVTIHLNKETSTNSETRQFPKNDRSSVASVHTIHTSRNH